MHCKSTVLSCLLALFLSLTLCRNVAALIDYKAALKNSLLFYEAQRSGKLPPGQRVTWRGDSGLLDGNDFKVNLTGGYYDAGDNVKFGFPMAFAITMMSWSVQAFREELEAMGELTNALDAIKWGTDYLINAHIGENILYGEVGDGDSDHVCWQRPEDMTTPRTSYRIDAEHPGADLAAETAAALAAASWALLNSTEYHDLLVSHAEQLYNFAKNHPGKYQDSIPVAGNFYSSSGYKDELMWAAAWLTTTSAPNKAQLRRDIFDAEDNGGVRTAFSWDDKFAGVHMLVAAGYVNTNEEHAVDPFIANAEAFICSCIQKGGNNIKMTPGGLLWFQEWSNLQYTTAATSLIAIYAKSVYDDTILNCPGGPVKIADLISFVRSQVDYILGSNPKGMSYMVGYGPKYPTQVHHRGASIVSIKKDPKPVTCQGGFEDWFKKNASDPNVLVGAIVGGPDEHDEYTDSRGNYKQAEPAIANVAPLVGVLAFLATLK